MASTKEIFLKARSLLQKGWCQHILTDHNGSHCAMGALNQAVHGDYAYTSVSRKLAVKLEPHLPEPFRSMPAPGSSNVAVSRVVRYNNHPNTTQEDIVNLFCKAAQHETV